MKIRKYFVKDEDGRKLEIEEEVNDEEVEPAQPNPEAPVKDEPAGMSLSEEEITALKSLASIADKLAALVADNPADEPVGDVENPEEEEEVIDSEDETDKELKKAGACDSKKSFGAPEKHTIKESVNDSVDNDLAVSAAWSKRSIRK